MAEFFSDAFIDEIRGANDIVDVVSEYVQLEKKGKDYFGLCPFHREKTPSFCVVPNKQLYYCFGCGKGGGVVHFIMEHERLDFVESVRFLANRAKIQVPATSNENDKDMLLKKEITELNREAARFFYNNLISENGIVARKYLENRKISQKTMRRFGLGYALNQWDSLYKEMETKGFSKQALEKSGLFSLSKKGTYIDKFRNRLMFPIFNITGSVIAFGGRLIDETEGPKYMNSPETLVYTKGRHLYALNFAKAMQNKQIYVVEGYMDVISMHQSGIINTVASLGTALTEGQARLLKKYAEEIIICYDSDAAGQAATMRGLDILKSVGCNVKVLSVTDGKDPDEYIRLNGPEAFARLAKNSATLLEYKVGRIKAASDESSFDGRRKLIMDIAEVLTQLDTGIEREMYIEKIAEEYGLSKSSILELVDEKLGRSAGKGLSSKTGAIRSQQNVGRTESKVVAKCVYDERMLLTFLCMENAALSIVSLEFSPVDYTGPDNIRVASLIYDAIHNGGISPAALLDKLEPQLSGVYASLIQKDCVTDKVRLAVEQKIRDIKNDRLDMRIEELRNKLKEQEDNNTEEIIELTNELNKIILMRKRS